MQQAFARRSTSVTSPLQTSIIISPGPCSFSTKLLSYSGHEDTHKWYGDGNDDQVRHETGDVKGHEDFEKDATLGDLSDRLPDLHLHEYAAEQGPKEEGDGPAGDEYDHSPEQPVRPWVDGEDPPIEEDEARLCAPKGHGEHHVDGPFELIAGSQH